MTQFYDEEGDQIEGFPYPKDNVCEECGDEFPEESALFDAIIYGKSSKVCDKCAKLCGALVIQKPTKDQVEKSKKPSTRDAMRRATGIEPKKADKLINSLTLEDMRQRAKALKEKKEKEKQAEKEAKEKEEKIFKKNNSAVLDEKEFLDYLENEVDEIKEEEKSQKQESVED